LSQSTYLTGSFPLSCDALLFSHLVKLYSSEMIPALSQLELKHSKLREYFQNICEVYFRSNSKISLKVTVPYATNPDSSQQANDLLYPPNWRELSTTFGPKKPTMKQAEVFLIYGENWQPPTPLLSQDGSSDSSEFSLKKYIRDEPCKFSSYSFPKPKELLTLSYWTSKSTSSTHCRDPNQIPVSYSGILFSSVVTAAMIYSIVNSSRHK
jgi:hypothetical protein